MPFAVPSPFLEALKVLARRQLLPTTMTTDQLQKLAALVRRHSFFSAQTAIESLLEQYKGDVEKILRTETDVTTARLRAKELLQRINYQPEEGKRGSIEDLSSDARINLVLKTNRDMMQGAGVFIQGQDPALLDEFPALELFRLEERREKRNWPEIWRGLGGKLFEGGRMIALKADPIWQELGNAPDGLGNPFPPFRFGSGMWTRNVDRRTAERLGLIQPGQKQMPNIQAVFEMFDYEDLQS